MPNRLFASIAIIGLAFVTAAIVGLVRQQLLRRQIVDRPNSRSSHTAPVPRGGGIGVLIVLLPSWLVADLLLDDNTSTALLIPLLAADIAQEDACGLPIPPEEARRRAGDCQCLPWRLTQIEWAGHQHN